MSACEQGAPGNTRQTVHPEFWRSSQQQNCRSFQNLDIRTIFGILLKEMDIRTHDILLRGMSPLPYNPNAANESSDYCINSLRCTAQIRRPKSRRRTTPSRHRTGRRSTVCRTSARNMKCLTIHGYRIK